MSLGGTVTLKREQLIKDFVVAGKPLALVTQSGIRRPADWSGALSIMTAATRAGQPRPYDDDEGPDGLQRYQFRRGAAGRSENDGL